MGMYEVHAVIVCLETSSSKQHIIFARRSDGVFMCYDDERVEEIGPISEVRAEIADRTGGMSPPRVQMIVYQRKGPDDVKNEPLQLSRSDIASLQIPDAMDVKRRRLA